MEKKKSKSAPARVGGWADDVFGDYWRGQFGSPRSGGGGCWGLVGWMEVVDGVRGRRKKLEGEWRRGEEKRRGEKALEGMRMSERRPREMTTYLYS